MELYDVMRTTFAMREFTDDPLPDSVLQGPPRVTEKGCPR
jgi:hypothetical protein